MKFLTIIFSIFYFSLFSQGINQDNLFQFWTVVEMQPSFPGGDEALKLFCKKNIVYPREAKEKGIEGKVFLTFIVEKDGSLTNISVIRSLGFCCDEEAKRVASIFPKWLPGKQGGRNVRVQFNLPIRFTKN